MCVAVRFGGHGVAPVRVYCSIWRKIHGFDAAAAADHHGVAAGLRYHGGSVFGRAHVAVADDGNLTATSLRRSTPSRLPGVSLLASAGVHGDGGQAALLRHLARLRVHNFLVDSSRRGTSP